MNEVVVPVDFKFLSYLRQLLIYRWVFSINKDKKIWQGLYEFAKSKEVVIISSIYIACLLLTFTW